MPKNYLYSLRRLALAGVIGLIGAALLLWVVGAQLAQPGGAALWLLTGGLIGVAYSALFTHNQADHTADLLRGLVVGLVTWSAWTLNLLPTLLGNGPMWQAEAVAHTVPQLIGCLLVGGWSGLLYSLLFARLAVLLHLEAPLLPTPALKTRMVVLGGGYAGVATAQSLEEEFANDPTVGIWLVSETNFLLHTPMLSEVAGSAVDAQNISPPLRAFFHKVQVVQGTVAQIDLATRTIRLAGDKRSGERVLPFDHLALTMGGIPNFFGNRSLEQRSFTLKSLEDAIRLRNQIIDMFERADSEPNQAKRQRMLTFVVAGGGFAGVELIGSLNDFARGIVAYYRNVDPAEVRLVLVHSGETILPDSACGSSKPSSLGSGRAVFSP